MCFLGNNFSNIHMFAVNGESKIEIQQRMASSQKSKKFTNSELSKLNFPEFTSGIRSFD